MDLFLEIKELSDYRPLCSLKFQTDRVFWDICNECFLKNISALQQKLYIEVVFISAQEIGWGGKCYLISDVYGQLSSHRKL